MKQTLTTSEAAELLGVSRDALYNAARDGTAPLDPIRIGRRILWPTAKLLTLLGIEPPAADQVKD